MDDLNEFDGLLDYLGAGGIGLHGSDQRLNQNRIDTPNLTIPDARLQAQTMITGGIPMSATPAGGLQTGLQTGLPGLQGFDSLLSGATAMQTTGATLPGLSTGLVNAPTIGPASALLPGGVGAAMPTHAQPPQHAQPGAMGLAALQGPTAAAATAAGGGLLGMSFGTSAMMGLANMGSLGALGSLGGLGSLGAVTGAGGISQLDAILGLQTTGVMAPGANTMPRASISNAGGLGMPVSGLGTTAAAAAGAAQRGALSAKLLTWRGVPQKVANWIRILT
ncbi:hypothetical protein Vretimale_6378, partial [Volvox reticuliferus]